MRVSVIIPALNEAASIGQVLSELPPDPVTEVLVVDGGSTDATAAIARTHGARVLTELRRGYGRACATGLAAAQGDLVVFLDADGAGDPRDLPALLAPLLAGHADLSLGSRLAAPRTTTAPALQCHAEGRTRPEASPPCPPEPLQMEPGAMPWHQVLGNRLAAALIRRLYGLPITDLSPFRATRRRALLHLGLRDMTYGWPTEMLVRAARQGWRVAELPVRCRKRLGGHSKISGTLRGTLGATLHILALILRYARVPPPSGAPTRRRP
jgi:glycosyltransferase involved in cell wall biosynthesis